MFKYFFIAFVFLHGIIHFIGFAKALEPANIPQITLRISKPSGFLWLATAILFIVGVLLFQQKKESWPLLFAIAATASQILIITVWKDAKFGTILNVIVLLAAVAGFAAYKFEREFIKHVKTNLHSNNINTPVLTDADIQSLPPVVQKYIRYSGAVNKPRVKNMYVEFKGQMRDRGKDWFAFNSVQYNFFNRPARLFYMKAKMWGLTVPGYHNYQHEKAVMNVKLFGLVPVVTATGYEMNKAETVTLFNDMCLLAPASLIDQRIEWESAGDTAARAVFHNGTNTISATLIFNGKSQLVNFISDDRYAITDMKQYRFSTPVKEYKNINGRNVPTYGETIWHYPEGEFIYGKFHLQHIEYNTVKYKENSNN